jgi:hypothetical protein
VSLNARSCPVIHEATQINSAAMTTAAR